MNDTGQPLEPDSTVDPLKSDLTERFVRIRFFYKTLTSLNDLVANCPSRAFN
jgi:hypothetical protein